MHGAVLYAEAGQQPKGSDETSERSDLMDLRSQFAEAERAQKRTDKALLDGANGQKEVMSSESLGT